MYSLITAVRSAYLQREYEGMFRYQEQKTQTFVTFLSKKAIVIYDNNRSWVGKLHTTRRR